MQNCLIKFIFNMILFLKQILHMKLDCLLFFGDFIVKIMNFNIVFIKNFILFLKGSNEQIKIVTILNLSFLLTTLKRFIK